MVRDELKSKAFPLRPEFVQSRTSRTEKGFLGVFLVVGGRGFNAKNSDHAIAAA